MTQLIILRGYPGSGKTTVGKQLQVIGIGEFIDHNAILTFIAGITGDDEGIYDEIARLELAMCGKLLQEGKDVIIARGFSSLADIKSYEDAATRLGVNTRVIRLDVSKQELIRRVQSPERQLDFNPTVDELHALNWIANNPLESHPNEVIVSNEKPLAIVIDNLKTIIQKHKII